MSVEDVQDMMEAASEVPDEPGDGLGATEAACPFVPLGARARVFYAVTELGELVGMRFNELREEGVRYALLLGDEAWAKQTFGSGDDDKGFPWKSVRTWFVKECKKKGLFDTGMPLRGPGVWLGARRRVVGHFGNAILTDEGLEPVGVLRDGALYLGAPPIVRPRLTAEGGLDAATKDVGLVLLEDLRRWRFQWSVGADLVLGWIGAALLGGAPSWRSHVYVTGRAGCGKSWLAELVSAALGGQGHPSVNNFTEPGLRQAMTGEARALVLDESENEASGGRVLAVIELLRHMSSGVGARALRGSSGGTAQSYTVTGCAYLSAILPVPLTPQDRSRITEIPLLPLPDGPDAGVQVPVVADRIAATERASPALRARALEGWDRFNDTLTVYRSALARLGCDPRQCDQIGTLLAGRDLLIADHTPDSDSADEDVAPFASVIAMIQEDDEAASEGRLCLDHLLTSEMPNWSSGQRPTVSRTVALARNSQSGADQREWLEGIGLKIVFVDNKPLLLVANNHRALSAIFANTAWSAGRWAKALKMLAEDVGPYKSQKFAGHGQRSTAIPERFLPELTVAEGGQDLSDDPAPGC